MPWAMAPSASLFATAASMPSAAHAVLLQAMREQRPVACTYQGHSREICPVMLGRTGLEEKALVFQFGGSTSQGRIPAPGTWKCFRLEEVRDAVLIDGRWHSGSQHSEAQHCMKMVEYDINPASPYNPAFKL
jgi:hypothetical protein